MMDFPLELSAHKPQTLEPGQEALSDAQLGALSASVALGRDAIVFFTAYAQARGLGGHTGGAYDMLPEVVLADAMMRGDDRILPEYFDEAGHRVALQYLMSVWNGHMEAERLLHYREAGCRLPGHPERGFTPGVTFSSGRLGHLWPYVNGIAKRQPDKTVLLFGSDGSQQEGNDAEAARFAVAHRLSIKLLIDDNDVTISGHPSDYLQGYSVAKSLYGHGLAVQTVDAEDLPALFQAMRWLMASQGPAALVCKRLMAPGIPGVEGTAQGHDAIAVPRAIEYLQERGHDAAVKLLKEAVPVPAAAPCRGSTAERTSVRKAFGAAVAEMLTELPADARGEVLVMDNDLEGSCGLAAVKKSHPDLHVNAGIMERGNYSAAAGFGRNPGQQAVYATFSAFLEMLHSEISMARMNEANVLAHFSHAGVAEIVDNTCHFGINNFYADSGVGEDNTRLYFPADSRQQRAVVRRVFGESGLRFVFSPRCNLPEILTPEGEPLYGPNYEFVPGIDEVVREGDAGWVVSYGDTLHLALDAVERLRDGGGPSVGLLNKPSANRVDEDAMRRLGSAKFVLVVESQNLRTGLGVRFGTWLLERGLSPRYARLGTHLRGDGGTTEQIRHQGLDSDSLLAKLKELVAE